jgi:O-antigen/teichoic acid export membrane protein
MQPQSNPQGAGGSVSARIAANSVWVGLDNLLALFSGFVASVLVARFYGPELVGNYTFMMWLVFLAMTIGKLGGVAVATRKFLTERIALGDYAGARSVLGRLQRVQGMFTAASVVVGAAIIFFMAERALYVPSMLALISIVPSLYIAIATGANAALEDFASNVKASVTASAVNFAGILIAVALHGSLTWLVAALLASRVADYAVRDLYRRRNYAPYFSNIDRHQKLDVEADRRLKQQVRQFFVQTAVLELVTLVVWDRSELMFLKYLGPASQVAFFSLPFSVMMQLDIVPRVLFISSATALIRQQASDPAAGQRMVRTIIRMTALITLPLSLGIAALAAPLMQTVYGRQYLAAIPVLAVVGVFGVARPFLMPARSYLVALARQDIMTWALALGSVVDLVLMFTLIPRWGAVGAAYSNGIAQMFGVVFTWWFIARVTGFRLPVMGLARALAAAAGMGVAVWGLSYALMRVAPPFVALVVGPVVGCAVYVVLLRLLGAVEASDRERLLSIGDKLPARARPVFRWMVALAAGRL